MAPPNPKRPRKPLQAAKQSNADSAQRVDTPADQKAAPRKGVAARRPKAPSPRAERTRAPKEAPSGAQRGALATERKRLFPIVGIGASAGGLEALELFFANVPQDSGMAYVVVQHLDPTHKGAMVELLQRATTVPVKQVTDREEVKPNRVYVIPPNKEMSIMQGMLHLFPRASPIGPSLPIDHFFRSLADEQQERCIGVILSGMGSDGTLGMRAIKEKGGACFVQSLESAKFAGMPHSVIESGLADVSAEPDKLPEKILAYHRHAPYIPKQEATSPDKHQNALEKVFILLRAQTGNDFSLYKRSTIVRRIERRMGLHQFDKLATYVRYLRENPHEIELLFKELLIGVTSFFRDPNVWEHVREKALPNLLREGEKRGCLRAWVPGCSTGEEAYSLAMILTEALEHTSRVRFQIFATDLDRDAIEVARQGVYPANIAADVSPERLRRFFVQDERGYRVRTEIRDRVVFAPQNIIMDPPFTKLDILACRNLLIYLSSELQKKLLPVFHYALNPGGVLILGSAETIGSFTHLFGPLDGKTRTYRRLEVRGGAPAVDFPPAFAFGPSISPEQNHVEIPDLLKAPPNLPQLADRVIVQRFSPAAVLTNDKGDVLYFSGRTGKYLEPAIGKANLNVFAMAREGLRYELMNAFASALRDTEPVVLRGIKVGHNGGSQTIDLTVQKLTEPKELRGIVIIAFTDVPAMSLEGPEKARRPAGSSRVSELQRELQQAREEVQGTREEMQTSQEELKSTNEELQSTNEELQSTNEELTTSKEEMQSMNEELQTVNHELQAKVDELSRSNNDMKNLLNSTDIATLFLDSDLLVRRFTVQTAKLIKLIPSDTGRSITDITSTLDYPELAEDAREVLRTLIFKEKQVVSSDDNWFTVRIMPYRTLENVIDGVVITFTDCTVAKTLEARLREQARSLRRLTDSLPCLVSGYKADGACDYVSQQWIDYTGIPEAAQLGYGWMEQLHPEDQGRVRREWAAAVGACAPLDTELRIRGADGSFRYFNTRAVPIHDEEGRLLNWYATSTDVDTMKRAAAEASEEAERLNRILEAIPDGFFAIDAALTVNYINPAAERMFDRKRGDVIGKGIFELFPPAARSVLEEKLGAAQRQQRAVAFRAKLRGDGQKDPNKEEQHTVRICPHAGGMSVFCQRNGA
ncbi:MAG: chemotaxis protein CheB [Polyangiaceae bacterium]